ncbi:MAG: hypothetical protein ABL909_08410 [Sphingopyxis sp.]
MKMFAMPDIGGGARDFWDYIRADRPHRWSALGLSIAIPLIVLYGIARSLYHVEEPKRSIQYVQSWPADRSEFDVRHDWLVRAREANDRNERRRNAYGSFAKALGQDYDKNAAHDEFDEARATIDQALRDLAEARAAGRPIPPLPRAEPETPPASAVPAAPAR